MLDRETKRKIDSARDILVGKIPDPKSQVEQITISLIYKFMDDMDKESVEMGGSPTFFTGDFEQYGWSKIFDPRLGGFDMLTLYSEAIIKMNQNPNIPQLFRDIFKNAFLPYRDPQTLKLFLKQINEFHYDHSEQLGDAFEYLLSVMSSQGDAGQFRTPRHIIDFIVHIVDPKKNETVCDPACGTAGFLISSYKHILKHNTKDRPGDTITPDGKKRLINNFVGYDIASDMVRLSLVNMYLHGFSNPRINEYDTLTSEDKWNETFDAILANPPFMTPKGGIRPHKRFSVQAKRSEVLFVAYIAEHLNPNGRAGVIVPEGIIFQSQNAYKQLRKMLVDTYLYAVVSLPAGVFNPYSGVKTSILLMDKNLSKKIDSILFVNVAHDGYDLGAQRKPIDNNDLPRALEAITNYKNCMLSGKEYEKKKHAHSVLKSKIADNGEYNLSGNRYKETKARLTAWPMVELGEVCNFIGGYAFKSKELNDVKISENDLPVIKIGSLNKNGKVDTTNIQFFTYKDSLQKYLIEVGDLLIALTGATVGKTAISHSDKLLLNQRVGLVRAKSNFIIPNYLSNLLLSEKFYDFCQRTAGGGAQGNISPSEVLSFKIPLPPLDIQKEIVAEIEGYQKIIDGARQIVENWKPKIKIDPTWPMVKLGDGHYFKIEAGGTPNSTIAEYWGGDVNWVTLVDLPQENFITEIIDTKRKITQLGLKKSSAILLPLKTVLVSSRATIGRVAIARIKLATNQGFKNVVIKDLNKVNEYYLALAVSTVVDEMIKMGTGSTYKEISKTNFFNLPIPLPPLEVQQEIVAEIEEEQKHVESSKWLIEINEGKIKDKIAEVWGE